MITLLANNYEVTSVFIFLLQSHQVFPQHFNPRADFRSPDFPDSFHHSKEISEHTCIEA